jgi:hypothetical protein
MSLAVCAGCHIPTWSFVFTDKHGPMTHMFNGKRLEWV